MQSQGCLCSHVLLHRLKCTQVIACTEVVYCSDPYINLFSVFSPPCGVLLLSEEFLTYSHGYAKPKGIFGFVFILVFILSVPLFVVVQDRLSLQSCDLSVSAS